MLDVQMENGECSIRVHLRIGKAPLSVWWNMNAWQKWIGFTAFLLEYDVVLIGPKCPDIDFASSVPFQKNYI